ncbi:MAG TPA: response regulator, partial [Gemmatimonadaceae bacterium]|nr:response regulator [Gemmatimonadaceae bacterium]
MSETKIKVLVAEDEVHLGQILSNFLTGRGYALRTVTDGRAALEALRAEAFDVALLDIVMPELDGLEVLKQVRADADP